MAEQPTRLPPIPDELIEAVKRAQAFSFIFALRIPGRYRADLFYRWGQMVGAPATAEELGALRGKPRRAEE